MKQLEINLEPEIWKDIEDYEKCYQISTFGRTKSLNRKRKQWNGRCYCIESTKEKILKTNKGNGYFRVSLCKNGKCKCYYVHKLKAIAFIPNPENKKEVNHIDGNKLNNKISNLEWVTRSENTIHAYKIGLNKRPKGINNVASKFRDSDIKIIRKLRKKGVSYKIISEVFNTCISNIQYIVKKQTWNHI